MKLKKFLKSSLAVLLVFGCAGFVSACSKDDNAQSAKEKQYEVYKLAAESGYEGTYEEWLASIKGEKGDKGEKGEDGTKGEKGDNGTTWLTGTDDPSEDVGSNGDFYYNSVSKKIFNKVSNDWVLITTIENGANGLNGINGKNIEFQVTSTHIQWRYKSSDNSEEWNDLIDLASLKGADGTNGINGVDGTNGARWFYGETNPNNDIIADLGDFYLNTSSYDIFTKTSDDVWVKLCNIKGAKGSKGEEGNRGASWIFGTEPPSEDIYSIVGDVYFDVFSQKIYSKNKFNQWILMCSLIGEKGETGAPGSQGEKGENGIDGREVEFQTSSTHIQWRYKTSDDSEEWQNLIDLASLKGTNGVNGINGVDGANGENGIDGKDGREIEFQTTSTHAQWRYKTSDDSDEWKDLLDLASLKGQDGVSLIDVDIIPDKWNINVTYKFTYSNNSSSYYIIRNSINENVFYSCSNETEFRQLLEYGVTMIKLTNSFTVGNVNPLTGETNRRLAVLDKKNMVIDLNGYSITPENSACLDDIFIVQSNNDFDVNITIKNGTLGSLSYNETKNSKAGITVFGGEGKGTLGTYGQLTINIENVVSYGYEYGLSSNGNWNGATINAINSKFLVSSYTGVDPESQNSVGAYLPADNDNIFVNCEFYGPTGVYVNGGNTKFVNSKIYAIGNKEDYVGSTNGFNSTGSALVVESSSAYSVPVNVNIEGGYFSSLNNLLIEKIENVTNSIYINGNESAILSNNNYMLSRDGEVLELVVNESIITVNNNSNLTVNHYNILDNGSVNINFTKVIDETQSVTFTENYVLFEDALSLVQTDLYTNLLGTYNKFYLNDSNLTYDSLKLNSDYTYYVHFADGNVNEKGVYSITKVTDSECFVKLSETIEVKISLYTNSFQIVE